MANWALLQEQLTGLPVAKRAKHGIHFVKGKDEVLAHFSGKPCHYEDAGVWKPIDTKLIAKGNGYYGCPHSDVLVHPDGRVAVEGTTYAQYTALPGTVQNGLVDNDRIVREFTGGRQYLYITENGFKQEIILDRIPTLTVKEAQKLLATVSGSLPLKYIASTLTATDALGNTYTYDNLTNLRTWLTNAVYPVVIDPDFSSQPDAAGGSDTMIFSNTDTNFGVSLTLNAGMQTGANYRGLIKFNISSIPDGSTASSGVLTLYCESEGDTTDEYVRVYRCLVEWFEGNKTGATPDPGTDGATKTYRNYNGPVAWNTPMGGSGTDYVATATASNLINTVPQAYNYTVTDDINTWLGGTANYGWFVINDATTGNARKRFTSSDGTTAENRPKLVVTYTGGATGGIMRMNMTGNMQMMAGGF